MAWKGVEGDQGIYFSTFDGHNWAPQVKILGIGTSEGPALAGLNNRLYMAWKGVEGDRHVYYTWIDDGPKAIWQAQRVVAFTEAEIEGMVSVPIGSSHGPSIVAHGDSLMAAWKGISGDSALYFASLQGDEWNGQIKIAGVGSSARPALAVFNNRLYMAWKGIQGDSNLYYSWLG